VCVYVCACVRLFARVGVEHFPDGNNAYSGRTRTKLETFLSHTLIVPSRRGLDESFASSYSSWSILDNIKPDVHYCLLGTRLQSGWMLSCSPGLHYNSQRSCQITPLITLPPPESVCGVILRLSSGVTLLARYNTAVILYVYMYSCMYVQYVYIYSTCVHILIMYVCFYGYILHACMYCMYVCMYVHYACMYNMYVCINR